MECASLSSSRRPSIRLVSRPARSSRPAPEDLELRRAQGPALRDHFEQTPLFPAEAGKATLDQFHQPPRRRQRSRQTPDPYVLSEGAVLERAQHELAQVK